MHRLSLRLFTITGIFLLTGYLIVAPAAAQSTQQPRQLVQEDSRSDKRVALVIGNRAYETAPLKNPVNDAQDMAQVLRELGFEVIYRENVNQADMKRAIREFGAKIRNGGVGLLYYAGHGVQAKGINYLVPVDAKVESEEEIEYEGVDAGFVLAQMESAGNRMNIVILDACRNNPFARSFRSNSQGLAQMNAPSGTLIAYATAPGSVASDGSARNGIYTQELLKNMRTPGLGIEEIFKRVRISVRSLTQGRQTPWESSSLIGDFYFAGAKGALNSSGEKMSSPSVDPAAIELAYWESIKDSSDPEDFKEYLEKYPNGTFATLARRRMQTLQRMKSTGAENKQTSKGVAGQSAKAKFFTFDLQECRISGATVACELTITNNDNLEKGIRFGYAYYRSLMLDDKGSEYKSSDSRLANREDNSMMQLASGITVKARVIFERVTTQPKTIKLLTLWFNTPVRGARLDTFKVEFRDVPLAQ